MPNIRHTVKLKGCGKSAPAMLVTASARQTPTGARPNVIQDSLSDKIRVGRFAQARAYG